MKKIPKTWLFVGVAIIVLIALAFTGASKPLSDEDTVASDGLHWHPELTIFVNGEKQKIPANIGLVGGHNPMHTHSEDASKGVIHFEFSGVVRPNDLRLENFFRVWGKDIMSDFGTLERMTVNGKESTEYGEYIVQETDKIELYYVDAGNDSRAEESTFEGS